MIAPLLDHLWQSSLVAALAAVLTLALRANSAAVRFWLWFGASVKFLLPFAALAGLGAALARLFPHVMAAPLSLAPAMQLSAPARLLPVTQDTVSVAPWLWAVWALGLMLVMAIRLAHGMRLRGVLRRARLLKLEEQLKGPLAVKATASLLEPGLVGICKPVVLLPDGLLARLTPREIGAILAHELSHARRRDNLTAAIHMTVEALFWFWPPVWWIGARLIAERERACDEHVLEAGHDPQTYAAAILKVCRFCMQSPLACVSGISGSNLKRRVAQIMTAPAAADLDGAKCLLLAITVALTLGGPVMAGFVTAPLARAVQAGAQQVLTQTVAVVAQQISAAPLEPIDVRGFASPRAVMALAPVLPPTAQGPAPVPAVQPQAAPPPAPTPSAASNGNKDVLVALSPSGQGDPDAVTCRVPQVLPGSRLPGPQVCKTNKAWAQLRAQAQEITADGGAVVAAGGSLIGWQNRPKPCTVTPFLGSGHDPPPTYCF